jgi:hypothetical protein
MAVLRRRVAEQLEQARRALVVGEAAGDERELQPAEREQHELDRALVVRRLQQRADDPGAAARQLQRRRHQQVGAGAASGLVEGDGLLGADALANVSPDVGERAGRLGEVVRPARIVAGERDPAAVDAGARQAQPPRLERGGEAGIDGRRLRGRRERRREERARLLLARRALLGACAHGWLRAAAHCSGRRTMRVPASPPIALVAASLSIIGRPRFRGGGPAAPATALRRGARRAVPCRFRRACR